MSIYKAGNDGLLDIKEIKGYSVGAKKCHVGTISVVTF